MTGTRGIDFSRLTLQDALDLAVLIEEEARDRYEEFAGQMETHRTPEAAQFFRTMVVNEEKHRAELAARRRDLFGDAPSRVQRTMLFDVEAPDYDEARAFMTARDALNAALRCEIKAHEFFAGALPNIQDAAVRALFAELRDEEVDHERLVRAQLHRLAPDDGFRADDFGDEPVAQ